MKVLFVSRGISTVGGKERSITRTCNFLSEYHTVAILTLDGSLKPFYSLNEAVNVYTISGSRSFGVSGLNRWRLFFLDVRLLFSSLRKIDADLIIANDYIVNTALALYKTVFKRKQKIVSWEHMAVSDPGAPVFWHRIRKRLYGVFDGMVVPTEHDRLECSLFNSNVAQIPYSSSFVCEEKAPLINKYILTIARFTWQKGIEYLLDVVSELRNKLNGWKFILIGEDGTITLESLQDNIRSRGIGDFIEIHAPEKAIRERYHASSIYLMTSRYEGLPLVLLEAMECGLPCVSFDCVTGPRDVIIDGQNGFLVPCFDVRYMVEKLEQLMRSDELRKEFGRNTHMSSDKFRPELIFSQWLHFVNGFEKSATHANGS